ncbi:MAG: glycyl-radical enzyme activating protein [Candidatus Aminicenantes bacterium]|nr:glycyl-radical enzyme activating protein [Candidatus Aminicenantes bacterium]
MKSSGRVSRKASPRGLVFDIKRFAVHDGPGIRTTVFLKGCPLHCLWCHNPEGIDGGLEIITRSSRCRRCYACVSACPRHALTSGPDNGPVVVDRAKCDLCGRCADVCMSEAVSIVGRRLSVDEVVAEVERDRIFYEQSDGGATLSGGEPARQAAFSEALLGELKARGIQTALDTSGLAPWPVLERLAARSDLVLYDLKIMDDIRHRKYAGASNDLILENLRRLAANGTPVFVRIPLETGVNDDEANIRATIDFLKPLPAVRRVDLLAYHKGGREKSRNLGKESRFDIFEPPSAARMEEIRQAFADAGFKVKIGG